MPTRFTRGATMVVAMVAGLAGLSGTALANQSSDGSGGVGSGNQINVPINVAIELCGNSIAVAGVSQAECVQIAEEFANDGSNQATDGSGAVASGNQVNIPVDVAVRLCGNSIAVAGISQAQCEQVAEQLSDDDATNQSSDGSGGVAGGNQVDVPIDADVEVCGTAVAILGVANAECVAAEEESPQEPEKPDDEECSDEENGGRDCDDDGGDDGCESDDGEGNEECEQDDGGEESGGGDCEDDSGNGADCADPDTEESNPGKDDETSDDAKAPAEGDSDSALPQTGSALYGILIAGLALVTFGGGAFYLSRRRKRVGAGA